jgi:LPXTG-motif cell wall-anchored protein
VTDQGEDETGKVGKREWPLFAALAAVIGALVFWRRRKHRAKAAE